MLSSNVPKFILASSSARRQDLLESINITPDEIISPDIDEMHHKKEKPPQYAKRMAYEKMLAVKDAYAGHIILTADTVVAKGLRILPKAETQEEFYKCMALLSGGNHTTMTAITICNPAGEMRHKLVKTKLKVKRLHSTEIALFEQTKQWKGKAGGYALQGFFGQFIFHISGSYSGVVGLPVNETSRLLQWAGYKHQNMS